MAKNKIQFQQGMSLMKFIERYGTEEKCSHRLFLQRWPNGFVCPKCGHTEFYSLTTRCLFQCRTCRYQSSLISGTIFSSSKLPLTLWFLAIYLITQSKDGLSSLNLTRLLGISYNSTLRMKHKLLQVMKDADDTLQLTGLVEVDDVYWGGKRPGGKRGRGASGKVPFIAAISRNEKGRPVHMRLSRVASFTSEEITRWSRKHINREAVVLTDGFNAFQGISESDLVHIPVVMTERYKDPDNKLFLWTNTMIGNVKKSLHGTYHAVSQKHLPRYLAEFSYRFNRRFNLEKMVDNLVFHAANSKPIPQHRLKLAEDWW